MSSSARAARMQRHHRRHRAGSGLNLVSLMDIFTILVFFLLVNSGETDILPRNKDLTLPESTAEQRAEESVVVMVTPEDVLVQGRAVAKVADIQAMDGMTIEPLRAALVDLRDRVMVREASQDIAEREITVMGDKALPFAVLKKVMATCTDAEYGRVSLAVIQKVSAIEGGAGEGVVP